MRGEEKKRGEEEDVELWFCPNMFRRQIIESDSSGIVRSYGGRLVETKLPGYLGFIPHCHDDHADPLLARLLL